MGMELSARAGDRIPVGDHVDDLRRQINLPALGQLEPYHNGTYEHRGWLPVRINCPPEITLVELVPA